MNSVSDIEDIINDAWEDRANVSPDTYGPIRRGVDAALDALDSGAARIAEPIGEAGRNSQPEWRVHQWLKKAVLLSFRLYPNERIVGGPGAGGWWDKVPSKFESWTSEDFECAGLRAVPPAAVRRGSYVAPDAVLMPSFVNIGAYVGGRTMVDTWATVGSCAQIGANCHISGGVGIGGVLEPLQANPVIVEDNCFIGARSEIAEGVIVREGAVLSMGVFLGASTKIVHRDSGDIVYGEVPPYAVIVPGTLPSEKGGPHLYCAVIVKQVDEKTRAKTSVNELLRS